MFNIIERFRFRLARELNKSLAEIDNMPFDEFYEWYEYSKKEPFNVDRNEFMIAQLSALMVNIDIKNSKSKKFRNTLDFLISIDEDTKEDIKRKELSDSLQEAMKGNKRVNRKN